MIKIGTLSRTTPILLGLEKNMCDTALPLPGMIFSGKPPLISATQRRQARVNFGEALFHQRTKKYPRRRSLAQKARVDPGLIDDLELGHETQARATVTVLTKIAKALDCDLIILDADGEEQSCHGASDTLEQLIAAGMSPGLIDR